MVQSFKKLGSRIAAFLPYLAPLTAAAQTQAPQPPFTTLTGLQAFVCTFIVNWIFTFLIILVIIFVLVAAFRYLTAAGQPDKVQAASHTLIYAGIAVVVAIFARGLPLIVGSLLNTSFTAC